MSKKRLNALLVAGCLTFLAPMSAHADDLRDKTYSATETLSTSADGTTFSTIIVNDTGSNSTRLTIDATNGSLTPNSGSAGSVTLNNTSSIVLSNAVNNVTFNSTIVNGSNKITYSNPPATDRNVNLGAIKVNAASSNTADLSLTLENIKASDYTSIGNNVNTDTKDVNYILKNSDLLDLDARNGQDITITANEFSTDAPGTVNINTINVYTSNNEDNPTKVNLNANEVAITQVADKSILLQGSGSTLNLSGTNAITLQKVVIDEGSTTSQISSNNTNANINEIYVAASNNNPPTKTTLSGVKATNLNFQGSGEIEGTNNDITNINLSDRGQTARLQGITATNINFNNDHAGDTSITDNSSNLEITGALTATNTNVIGTNSIKNSAQSGTVALGNIKVDASSAAATLTLENVKGTNYNTIGNKADSDKKDVTYNLKASDLKGTTPNEALTVNAGQNVTVNGTSGDSTIDTITLTAGTAQNGATPADITILNINANGGNITQADGKQINLNNNTKLSLSENTNSTLSLKKVAIQDGATATISNSTTASGAEITDITIGTGATATLENVKYGNYESATIGSATINLKNSELKTDSMTDAQEFKVTSEQTVTVNSQAGTDATSANPTQNKIAKTILEKAGTGESDPTTTLTLTTATNSNLNVDSVKMNGNNALNINSSNITIGGITVQGSSTDTTNSNNIENTITKGTGATNVSLGDITLLTGTETNLVNIKSNDYGSAIVNNQVTVNLNNSDLEIGGTDTAQLKKVETTGSGNLIKVDNTNINLGTVSLKSNSGTTLENVKEGKYGAINVENGVTVTAKNSDLIIGGNNTAELTAINSQGTSSIKLNNSNVTFDTMDLAEGSNTTLTGISTNKYESATVNNNATVKLNDSVLKIGGTNTATGIDINSNGTSTININNDNTKLDDITLADGSTTTFTNVKNTNYGEGSSTTLDGSATVNLNNSHFVGGQVNREKTLTINATGNSSTGNIELLAGTSTGANPTTTSLNLKSDTGATLTTGTLTLNTNTALKTEGAGVIVIDGINVVGNSSINNSNTNEEKTNFGNIVVTDAILTTSNVTKDIYKSLTLSGSGQIKNVDDVTDLDEFKVTAKADGTAANTVVEASSAGVTFKSATFDAGVPASGTTQAKVNTLTLNASGANISATDSSTAIIMKGDNRLNVNKSENWTVQLDNINVSGTNNTINNQATGTNANQAIGNIAYADGGSAELLGSQFTVGNVTVNGTNTLATNASTLSNITFDNASDKLTLTAKGNTTVSGISGNNIDLTLNADAGTIDVNTDFALNGNGNLELSGTQAVTTDKITVTGSANTITGNNANATIGALEVGGQTDASQLSITPTQNLNVTNFNQKGNATTTIVSGAGHLTAGATTITGTGNEIINNGTGSDLGTLNVNGALKITSNGGDIKATEKTTINNGSLTFAGNAANENVTNSVTLNGIDVTGGTAESNNIIARQDGSDVAIGLGSVDVKNNAYLKLENIKSNEYSGITLGNNSTVNLDNSDLKNTTLGNVTTTINGSNGASTYGTITATTSSPVVQGSTPTTITLNAEEGATLTGVSITAGKFIPLGLDMTGDGKVTNSVINASGIVTLNKTNTHAESTFGTINLDNATLTVNGLNGNDHTFGTILAQDKTVNTLEGSYVIPANTIINATNSTLADINLTTERPTQSDYTVIYGPTQKLTINANDTGVAFSDITLNQNTELVLNSNGNGLTGNSIAVNGNTATSFTDNADSTQTISLLGDIKVNGSNNHFHNGTNNTVNADELVFESSNSTADLNGENGYVFTGGTSISANSTLNQNSAGNVNLGDITFDAGDSFTLNATAGNTLVNDFIKNTDANINATLNANGGNIEKVTSTTLSTGDSLTLAGSNAIKMENVTVSSTGKLNVHNNATDIDNLTLEGNAELNTTNGSISETSIDNLTVSGDGEATWKLDYAEVAVKDSEGNVIIPAHTADTLKFGENSNVNKIKFEIADRVSAATLAQSDKYVQYIKLVDSDTSVLKSTEGTHGIAYTTDDSGDGLTYYSYEDGNTKNYDANTIRVTNYKIDDDALLDKLTLQGNRDIRLTDGTHFAGLTEITAYPNMQVKSEDETNTFVIKSVYDIDGRYNDTSDHKTQLFVVDATDANSGSTEVNRVLNIAGASMNNALSDSTVDTRDNNGAGAALYVKTNENTGSVTVNLATYKEKLATPTATPTTDALNPNSYQNTVVDGLVTELVKDVAFAQNTSSGNGGAIYNDGVKSKITGRSYTTSGIQFNSNQAGVTYTDANGNTVTTVGHGGAIYNTNGATFETKAGSVPVTYDGKEYEYVSNGVVTLTGNKATGNGGAIYNDANVNIEGNVLAAYNYSAGNGGAVYNTTNAETPDAKGTVELKSHNIFVGNTAGNTTNVSHGGAIYNDNANLTLGANDNTITLFVSNLATGNGGAIASINNDLSVNALQAFDNNASLGNGGAIYAEGSTDTFAGKQNFTNNVTAGKGGAIYAKGSYDSEGNLVKATTINLTANQTSKFEGNLQNATFATEATQEGQYIDETTGLVKNADGTFAVTGGESNAIYLDGDATVNLATTGEGAYVFQDKIASGNANNTINQNGTAFYNNDMSGYNGTYNLQSGHAFFTDANSVPFQGGDYILNGGSTLHLNNGKISTIAANSLDLSGTSATNPANLAVDINLTNGTADHFELNNAATGNMLISGMDIQGDPNNKKSIFVPIVVDKDAANQSTVAVETTQKVYETPGKSIYDYDILGTSASGLDNGLLFKRQALDPAFRAPQVSANARLAGQLDLLNNVLHRVDEIAENRYFHKAQRNNLYAADPDVLDDTRIDNGYTPYVNQEDGGSAWTKVYGTIETNRAVAQSYRNRAYNAFFGYETPVATLKNGWDLINTVFGGYQGSFQKYDSVENYQNGGSAGYMANLYHNNFFAGGVVMMGGTNVDVNDKGKHNRDMNYGLFDIGASVRTGYNVGMGQHWLLQPMLTTSYIFISGINRHNANGEKYDMEGTNTLQIAPGFKLVGNYNGWQPYVLFDYTWPIIAQTNATVNDQKLDHLRLKSYMEYGVGFRKNIGERFVGHAETVMRHGGRSGISFQGGLVFKF